MSEPGKNGVDDVLLLPAEVENIKTEMSKVDWVKARRMLTNLAIGSIIFPCLSVFALSIYRVSAEAVNTISMVQESEMGGEFDPTMGEQVSSENGRALVVVHEGYGMEINPNQFKDNTDYQNYLRILEAKKELYYENGDVVLEVFNDLALQEDTVKISPRENTLFLVTSANNGFTLPSFIDDGVAYKQTSSVWDILKEIGVDTVEVAGEFRELCAKQVFQKAVNNGLETEWCQDCVFPTISEDLAGDMPISQYPNDLEK